MKSLKSMDTTTKIAGAGAIAILVLAVLSYNKGKANGSTNIDHVPLPTEGGLLSNTDSQLVREIVLKLHNSLNGFGFIFRDEKPFFRLSNANDKYFIAIYNDFNMMYAKEDKGTLRNWINDDWYQSGTQTAGAVITILGRMDTLNLV
jgi:hypothetical protein